MQLSHSIHFCLAKRTSVVGAGIGGSAAANLGQKSRPTAATAEMLAKESLCIAAVPFICITDLSLNSSGRSGFGRDFERFVRVLEGFLGCGTEASLAREEAVTWHQHGELANIIVTRNLKI